MSKTSKPKQNRRKVKVTVKRVAKAQSEASRIIDCFHGLSYFSP